MALAKSFLNPRENVKHASRTGPFAGWPILIAIGSLMMLGCQPSKGPVTVFVSGDTAGWITPCGCTSNQSGGLARRATVIRKARQSEDVLVLDVGGAIAGRSAYDLLKLRAILAGQMSMGIHAFNLGGPEAQFTPTQLRELQQQLEVPFLSANLRDLNGNPIAPAMIQLESGGQRIAVIGVVDPDRVGEAMTATDPYRSVYNELRGLQADRIIVLAYMEESALKELAKKLPDVDAVIGGPTGQIVPPSQVGHVLVSSSTNKGKFLLKMQLPIAGRADANVLEVTSEIDEAREQQDNLKEFYRQLAVEDFEPSETQFVSARLSGGSPERIAGSESCHRCHEPDDAVWHDSKHAHAWAALEMTGAQVDPSCQRCHTTGYGIDGGFRTMAQSGALVSVGCENCHGPSEQHAKDPITRTPFVAKEQCVTCHDHENSPKFDYAGYWAKITHGKDQKPKPDTATETAL